MPQARQLRAAACRDVRTSQGTFISRNEDKEGVLAWIEDKIASLTGLPVAHGEVDASTPCLCIVCIGTVNTVNTAQTHRLLFADEVSLLSHQAAQALQRACICSVDGFAAYCASRLGSDSTLVECSKYTLKGFCQV